jgi:hypothetical protein
MTLDPQKVANHLGVPAPDGRMVDLTRAAQVWVERRRSATDPIDLWLDPAVVEGAVRLAALWYTQRAQPQGFPGIDDLGNFSDDTGNAWADIYRMVGKDYWFS